jgi:nitroreductase
MSATLDDVLSALNWRYACKKFDATKTIPADTWSALEQALVLSPSSYGLQPWKFFNVQTPAVREELLAHSWNQRQVVDASHLVVLAVKKDVSVLDAEKLVQHIAQARNLPVTALEAYKGMMAGSISRATPAELDVWMSRQVFIALGVILSAAAMLRVDACPMEGFVPEKYDEILGLNAKGYASRVLVTLGYRATDDAYASYPKVRYPVSEMVETL